MDDFEDDARYPPKLRSLNRSKKFALYPHSVSAAPYGHLGYDDDELDDDDDDLESDENDMDDDNYNPRGYSQGIEQFDEFARYPKRQKVRNLATNYEFAPRAPRLEPDNSAPEWSEHEKFVLLEVWGDKFLQLGRNSLRSDDWIEVAEKVSETLKIMRTEAQCRQMMDILKRKYKKDKAKGGSGGSGKWPYFRKMDMLMKQEFGGGARAGLGCGLDSGEFVFMDTGVYLDRANGNDEMRDSPCESEEEDEEEMVREQSGRNDGAKGLRVLADSVQKFGEIYEKIESSKKEQMIELERMRVEFQRELELQKKQILERAQAEIAKIREGEEEDDDDDDDGGDGDGEEEEEEEVTDNDDDSKETISQ